MVSSFLKSTAWCLLAGGVAGAATLVPGFNPGDGLFNYRVIDIVNGAGNNDHDVNDTNEAVIIADGITPAAGTGLITVGSTTYFVDKNDVGTIAGIDNGSANRDYASPFQLDVSGYEGQDFVIRYSGYIYFAPGNYTMRMDGDDGSQVVIPGVDFDTPGGRWGGNGVPTGEATIPANQLFFNAPTGSSNTGGTFTIGAGGLMTTFEATWYERGGGDYFEVDIIDSLQTSGSFEGSGPSILQNDLFDKVAISSTPFTPIPEPSGVVLLTAGSLLALRRRR